MSLLAVVGVAVTTYVVNKAKRKISKPGAPVLDPMPSPNPIPNPVKAYPIPYIVRKKKGYPKPGSIVITKLPGEWHSGIYIGNNKIAEVQGGNDSRIRIVSPNEFRDEGLPRIGFNIFIACDKKSGKVISSQKIANRALSKKGNKIDYGLIINNCHQFSRGCITGNFKGDDGEAVFETIKNLDKTINKHLNNKNRVAWHIWDYK